MSGSGQSSSNSGSSNGTPVSDDLQWNQSVSPASLHNLANLQWNNSPASNMTNHQNIAYQRPTMPGYIYENQSTGMNNFIPTNSGPTINPANWSNQPGLGGQVSHAPRWIVSRISNGGVQKPKRIRTAFSSQQMMDLEREYSKCRYLDRSRRIELAGVLQLSERTIKIWYQNRRMKEKKDRIEASAAESYPEITDMQMPMFTHEHYSGVHHVLHNQGHIEQLPTTSTSEMPVANMLTPVLPEAVQHNTEFTPTTYTLEQLHGHQQAVHQEVEQYPVHYNIKVQEVASHTVPTVGPASSSPTAASGIPLANHGNIQPSSAIVEERWSLPWLKNLQMDEEF